MGLGGQWGPGLWNQSTGRFPVPPLECFVHVANMGTGDGSDKVDLRKGGRTEEKPRHPEPLLESHPPRPPAQSQDTLQFCLLPVARTPIPGPVGAIPSATSVHVLSHTHTPCRWVSRVCSLPHFTQPLAQLLVSPISKLTDPAHVITLPSARGSASGCNLLSTDLNVHFAQRSGMGR